MVGSSKAFQLILMMAIVSGCQKAKMTHRQPVAQPVTPIVQAPPMPIPQPPQNTPLPPVIAQEEYENITIGPDPQLPAFTPTPSTPIEDDGSPLDENIFSQNQQGGIRPNISNPNVVEWFQSGYSAPALKQCGNCEPEPEIHQCRVETLPANPKTDKIDILFVVDTSASMIEERSLIAEQMGSFIDELNPNVDYQIAVMPAHGPKNARGPVVQSSPGNFFGELYSSGSGDPAVISYRGIQGKRAVIQDLRNKMKSLPNDRSYAQGEVGLLGLFAGLTKTELRNKMKSQGFLRDNAALAVIFVADENDACYDYGKGGKPNYDGSGRQDPNEKYAFDNICKLSDGTQLAPKHVLQALMSVKKNMPIILTGIVYTSEIIPKKGDKYAMENEMGRGYLDLIHHGHGQAVDLADRNFGKSLAQLGDYSQFRMEFDNVFLCKTNISSDKIDLSSFDVVVNSKGGQELGRFSTACASDPNQCPNGYSSALAQLDSTGKTNQIEVYLNLADFQKIAEPSAKVNMSFKTYGRADK